MEKTDGCHQKDQGDIENAIIVQYSPRQASRMDWYGSQHSSWRDRWTMMAMGVFETPTGQANGIVGYPIEKI